MNLAVVILAAGRGTRMKSTIPKVCHMVGEKSMIEHVTETAKSLTPKELTIVVSNENINEIKKKVEHLDVRFKIQSKPLGTAHAVLSAFPCCNETLDLLVLLGDVPLIKAETLRTITTTEYDAVIVGFFDPNKDNRFGRIVTNKNRVSKIVEYNEATEKERSIPLCNSGMLWIKSDHVPLLYKIQNNNSKGEYYLTDIVEIMTEQGLGIGFLEADKKECMGVNTQEDLVVVNNST